MITTDQQYQRLMKEYQKSGAIGYAAMKAGMDRKTARRYVRLGKSPSELRRPRTWRTREDPVKAIWPEAERMLQDNPTLEAKELFEFLLAERPGAADARAQRTFRRRVARWKHEYGPPKEVCFPQVHEPGQVMQVDWTWANELKVTIQGQPFDHLLCHSVLPYSNWEWAIPCQSESFLSLVIGAQDAYWELGGTTQTLQTDHSSTATHQLKRDSAERGFNEQYLAFGRHLGVEVRTITVACPNQNGDIEAMQGHLKRRLEQKLLLRRSRDFGSVPEYAAFVAKLCRDTNKQREGRLQEELARLRPLPPERFPQTKQVAVRVSTYSTARVKNSAYSVPSRLIGQVIQAHLSEQTVSFYYLGRRIVSYPRSVGGAPRIDYRHIIASLVRKPGAFARYLYREELFPRPVFRHAYDWLKAHHEPSADRSYLKLLALAADIGEDPVSDALGAALREGDLPDAAILKTRLSAPTPAEPASLAAFQPDLTDYDQLLSAMEVSV
jgi:transposase